MKKEEFLQTLREKLSILEKSEIDDIINEYREHIDEKKKTKKKEEEIIEEFGDVDELSREILKAYKINDKYNNKSDFNDSIKKWFNKFEEIINKIVKKLTTATAGEIIKFIIELCIISLLIALLKIPFEFVENLLGDLFLYLPEPFNMFFYNILHFLVEVSYIIVGFLTFIVIFKERYLEEDDFEFKSNRKNFKKEKTEISEKSNEDIIKNKKEKKIKTDKSNSAFDSLTNILFIFVKLLIAFICLPFLFTFIISIAGLIISIVFSIKYIEIIGIIIIMIGTVLAHYWIISIFYNILFNKQNNGKVLFILFILSLALIGSGAGYSVLEFGELNILDMDSLNPEYTTKNYEYNLNNILNENNRELDIDYRGYLDNIKINTVYDNTLSDKVIIRVKYYNKLNEVDVMEFDYYTDVYISNYLKGRETFNFVINNLKEKRIYDLSTLETYITIYVSENNKDKINY